MLWDNYRNLGTCRLSTNHAKIPAVLFPCLLTLSCSYWTIHSDSALWILCSLNSTTRSDSRTIWMKVFTKRSRVKTRSSPCHQDWRDKREVISSIQPLLEVHGRLWYLSNLPLLLFVRLRRQDPDAVEVGHEHQLYLRHGNHWKINLQREYRNKM